MNTEHPEQQKTEAKRSSRRAFTKAGIAAPVLLSIVSRPSWAVSLDACSFRQALSGNISADPNTLCRPNAPSTQTPDFYRNGDWAEVGLEGFQNTSFNSTFGSSVTLRISGNLTTDPSFIELLNATANNANVSEDKDRVWNYIAAFLNASSPVLVFPFLAADIQKDWGTFGLEANLIEIQASPLNVTQVNDTLNP